MDILKLHVEVQGNKFDGEGPAEIIREAYQGFLDSLGKQIKPAPAQGQAFKDNPPPGHLEELYRRVFVEREGLLTLQALPRSSDAGDALILILHGYQRLKPEEYPLTAVRLMQSARLSGANVDRIHRALESKEELLLKSGFRRSTRYSLNNPGEQAAIEIMKNLYS